MGAALALGLLAAAYHALLASLVESPSSAGLEGVFFRPGELPGLFVVGVAGWLLWMRRERWRALPQRSSPAWAGSAAFVGTALFVWARLTGAVELLLPSLAANGLALAAAARGRAGARVAALPALVLCLGLPIPPPIQDEIVWFLQRASASGTAWLLGLGGWEFVHNGVEIRVSEHSFQVIDACSGFSGIQILTLIALIVRDLFGGRGLRSWVPVLAAPLLAHGLNVLRILYITTSPNPEALAGLEGDHTPQGVAVLAAGTAILYALGWGLSEPAEADDEAAATAPERSDARLDPGPIAIAWLAVLTGVSFWLPTFEPPRATRATITFPERGGGWTSERLPTDPYFVGAGMGDAALFRLYTSDDDPGGVELFVARQIERIPTSSALLSSKQKWPGPGWNSVRERATRVWLLDRDADLVVTSRRPGGEHAVAYVWHLNDEGIWRESLRALLALDATPLRRSDHRTVVRLTAFSPGGGQLLLDRTKQRLDRFVEGFREELSAL